MSEHHSPLSALWKLRELAIARLDGLEERNARLMEELQDVRRELGLINALIVALERGEK